MSGKIMHVFTDVSMSNGFPGLTKFLSKQKKELGDGEFALFINSDFTACKIMTNKELLLHHKRPRNRPIDPDTLPLLPRYINGGKLEYGKALEQVIRTRHKELANK